MKYGKLVRDRIPEVIKSQGKTPVTRAADEKELIKLLKEKVLEEAKELNSAANANQELGEIVDILETINSYMKAKGISVDSVEKIRKRKLRERGGFGKRIVLESVE